MARSSAVGPAAAANAVERREEVVDAADDDAMMLMMELQGQAEGRPSATADPACVQAMYLDRGSHERPIAQTTSLVE